jgi:hypothetical protein
MIITKDPESQRYIISSMNKPQNQAEYNQQHNSIGEAMNMSAYQMVIEQIVTGNRGYVHPVFGIDGSNALDAALEEMTWRGIIGYTPELPRKGITRHDYVIQGDDVSNDGYGRAIIAPLDPSNPVNPTIGWEPQKKNTKIPRIF